MSYIYDLTRGYSCTCIGVVYVIIIIIIVQLYFVRETKKRKKNKFIYWNKQLIRS